MKALADAVALGRCVAEAADVPAALAAYGQRRLDRTRRIAAAAWRLGWVIGYEP